eukprot:TRINITY_DN12301_c0_g2_i1.p1 TRINITY_DN12301_c0_g2~~TRINITY_DN12301_c0_g2_i1.p1  ORF type:complete len:591 (-),score=102.82 TRINITY_DN12301_c0_g2_i1:218-1795(-)
MNGLGHVIRNELKQFTLPALPSSLISTAQASNAQVSFEMQSLDQASESPKTQSSDQPLEPDGLHLPSGSDELRMSANSCYTSLHDTTSDLRAPLLARTTRTDGAARELVKLKSTATIEQSHIQNQQEIQRTVQAALEEHLYDVEDLYSDSGIWQAMARQGSCMSNMTGIMILMNMVWIGIDTDYNAAPILAQAPVLFQAVDNLFCAYFVFELVVRLLAFRNRLDALRDPGYLFDAVLVGFMVWETWIEVVLYWTIHYSNTSNGPVWIIRTFRLFRLVRVGRIIRFLQQLPELMILIKGMGQAMRSVAAVLSLLAIVIYVFAILFTQLLRNTELGNGNFGGVLQAMNFLLVQLLTGFDATYMERLYEVHWAYYLLFLAYLFMTSLAMLNMLVGILCDVISKVTDQETDGSALEQLHHEIAEIAEKLDEDRNGYLSKEEFEGLMQRPEALRSLDNLGVDLVGFVDFVRFVFPPKGELALTDFCHMIGQFRGSNVATVKDIVDMRKYISRELDSLEARLFGSSGHKLE